MKRIMYETGKSFVAQKKAADQKHQPLYIKLKLQAPPDELFDKAGPINLEISAGTLERCRRLTMSDSLSGKLALGHAYRIASVYMEDPRILVRLRWQDSKGYFAKGRIKQNEPLEEHIFAIPEDVFFKVMARKEDILMA